MVDLFTGGHSPCCPNIYIAFFLVRSRWTLDCRCSSGSSSPNFRLDRDAPQTGEPKCIVKGLISAHKAV